MIERCQICETIKDVTHKAWQKDASPRHPHGGAAGPLFEFDVGICKNCAIEHNDMSSLRTKQED